MSRRDKISATGRNDRRTGSKGASIVLRRSFWESPQISVLGVTARALLIELTAMYWGPNSNGKLFLSVRDAAHRLGLNDTKAASTAFDELVKVGLLTVASAGHFGKAGRNSRARAFRLNWKDDDGSPSGPDALPDLDFGSLTPKQKRRVADRSRALCAHRKEKSSVGDSPTVGTIWADMAAGCVADSPTLGTRNGEKPPSLSEGDSPTHIYYQRGLGSVASIRPSGRITSDRPRSLKEAIARRRRPGRKRPRQLRDRPKSSIEGGK